MKIQSSVPDAIVVRSTGDISLEALADILQSDGAGDVFTIDPQQTFYKSTTPPSFVELVSALPWWGQLGAYAVGTVATGYLTAVGASLWKNQKDVRTVVSERLWSLAERIIALHPFLPAHTKIKICFPGQDEHFPIFLNLDCTNTDYVALQIAALCYHAPVLEAFMLDPVFDPALTGWLEVLGDGSIELFWQRKTDLERVSMVFRPQPMDPEINSG